MVTGDSDDDTRYADNDVTGMIGAVIVEHPEAAHKFLVTTPSLMAKAVKARSTATKRKATTADLDSDDDAKPKPKPKGKAKKEKAETDDEEPPAVITYYISIPKPAVLKKRGTMSKAADDDSLQKGPFSLLITAPYSSLLSAIATALPCRRENINESKIVWKPKKLKNAEKLPLGKEDGYKVMISDMEDKAMSAWQVLLYMPPPAKPMEDKTPWETNGTPEPAFDYSELEPTLPSDSLYAQKQLFNKTTKEERTKLEEMYPVGNFPQFPDIRVYRDKTTGFYYELNSTRIGIWSSSMAQGHTDEKIPPPSKFFDTKQRIKTVPAAPIVTPAIVQAPPIPAVPAVPAPTAPPSFSDLMFAHLLMQSGGGSGLGALLPQFNPAPAAPSNPQQHRSAPPSR
ncbi:hypothetical protein DFH07DRAFT_778218 [Mycena maculata]|uniref:Uncharacterized protein n=1 Tax=Mycena maculata TaxID=230809 RepID=A0AAD7IFL8_9AGAR|nr:hypothetical protein DFH07DRAFT_778218 [Mycena maculata]